MAIKQKPCALSPKHKWEFVKNIAITKVSYGPKGNQISVSFRGLYKCACGVQRVGQSQYSVKGGE